MNILIFTHLGLGNQFIMNGYIHSLLDSTINIQEICILAKKYTQKTLEHLYSDYPKITFYCVNESETVAGSTWETDPYIQKFNKAPFGSEVECQGKRYTLLNFGVHSTIPFDIYKTNWTDAFYRQGNIDPIARTHFRFPTNLSNAATLYKKIVEHIGTDNYIVLHEDPSRNINLHKDTLLNILRKNKTHMLPVIYLGKDRYTYPLIDTLQNKGSNELLACDSVLDYYFLIQNATECHFIDSSIGVMADYIKKSKTKLYNHQYATLRDNKTNANANAYRVNTLRDWTYLSEKEDYKPTISVIIASYNRFDNLLDTIKSIQLQTYPVLEIIVVNDGSDDVRYKTINIPGITMLHNDLNTKKVYGFPNISQVRNKGIQASTGDYIAFCDDDDLWLPEKLELQMSRMKADGTYCCSTDGYYCATPWDSTNLEQELQTHFSGKYPKYNAEHYWPRLIDVFGGIQSFPTIWTYPFIMRHNGMILSSFVVYKRVFEITGMFQDLNMRENPEDYDLWKRILKEFPMSYIEHPCFAYAIYPHKYG